MGARPFEGVPRFVQLCLQLVDVGLDALPSVVLAHLPCPPALVVSAILRFLPSIPRGVQAILRLVQLLYEGL